MSVKRARENKEVTQSGKEKRGGKSDSKALQHKNKEVTREVTQSGKEKRGGKSDSKAFQHKNKEVTREVTQSGKEKMGVKSDSKAFQYKNKEISREGIKEVTREVKQNGKEKRGVTREERRDVTREVSREKTREVTREGRKDVSREGHVIKRNEVKYFNGRTRLEHRPNKKENPPHKTEFKHKKTTPKIGTEKNRLKGLEKVKSRDLTKELNKEFEIARVKKADKSKRTGSLHRLFSLCCGNFARLCFKRNTAKIIQCLIKYSDSETVDKIFEEVQADLLNVIARPFGRFVLEKLYLKDAKYKSAMFGILQRNLKTIVTDRVAIHFLDDFYSDLNNKAVFLEGLYLNEKEILYTNVEMPLDKIDIEFTVNKMISKGLLNVEIAHDILELFIRILDARKRDSGFFLASLSEYVPDFLFTENGLKLAKMVFNGNEDVIMQAINPYFLKIATDEYGVEFILYLLQTLRDSKQKDLKDQVLRSISTLLGNEISSKLVMQYIDEIEMSEELNGHLLQNFVDYATGYNNSIIRKLIDRFEDLLVKGMDILNGLSAEETNESIDKCRVSLGLLLKSKNLN